jgi:heme oxygenase (biliverdin-IX-beta and delta-forming)
VPNRSSRQHAGPGPSTGEPPVPEPSYAERARTLVHLGRIGSLSTLSQKRPGWPFGSVMPYGLDQLGRPSFLISTMAMHTQNIVGDPRASLLVTQPDASGNPLGAARVTLMGKTARVPEAEVNQVRDLYLARYENAKYWVDFSDFAFYRMEVVDIYYVGGFGVMGWVAADEYARAEADPLAGTESEIIRHMNADHADALVLLARGIAGVEAEEAAMTSVDRLGFHLRLKTGDRMHAARIPFTREVRNTQEARTVLIEMIQQAKQRV